MKERGKGEKLHIVTNSLKEMETPSTIINWREYVYIERAVQCKKKKKRYLYRNENKIMEIKNGSVDFFH